MARLHRTRTAWLLAAMLIAAPVAAQEAPPLTGAAAWQALVGNTVVVTIHGGDYAEFYAPDGALRRRDGDGTGEGRWALDGDQVCLDYPDDDDRVCLKVAVQGTAGRFTDPDGTVDGFQILPGNPKGL